MRAGLPFRNGALVAAYVDIRAGEDLGELVEHVCAETDGPFLEVQHVLADAPAGVHLELAPGVPELRVRGDGGQHVPGHVDLGHDGDEPPGRVGHDLGQVGLGVVATVGRAVAAALRIVARRRLAPPGSDLGQQRVTVYLEPPTLVVGQVQVQHVEFVQAGQVDQPQHEALGEEVAGHVEVDPAPSETGAVLDLDALQFNPPRRQP